MIPPRQDDFVDGGDHQVGRIALDEMAAALSHEMNAVRRKVRKLGLHFAPNAEHPIGTFLGNAGRRRAVLPAAQDDKRHVPQRSARLTHLSHTGAEAVEVDAAG